jgi:hypothetical protein
MRALVTPNRGGRTVQLVHDETAIADAEAAIEATLAPVRDQLATVQELINTKLSEVEKLKAVERRLTSVIRAGDPDAPRPGPRKGSTHNGRDTNKWNVSNEKLNALTEYLAANLNGEAFTTYDLLDRDDFDLMSKATVQKALAVLTERGTIRLDRLGEKGTKIYKLARPAHGKP